jgi:hypothetical protein
VGITNLHLEIYIIYLAYYKFLFLKEMQSIYNGQTIVISLYLLIRILSNGMVSDLLRKRLKDSRDRAAIKQTIVS